MKKVKQAVTLKRVQVYLGCDPEFFFTRDNKVIGAEKVLPQTGLQDDDNRCKVIIDGVQGELNPKADTCRETLAGSIARGIQEIQKRAKRAKCEVSLAQTVSITPEEMDSLSDKCKQFGCAVSHNVYDTKATTGVTDASKYFTRSAGGHIHIGYPQNNQFYPEKYLVFKQNPERIVKLLDIIVGNFCVMVDRDKGNIIRRKTYGRAGEYRTPKHGIEYRTLSNFWLQNYTLMSMVFSLARVAVSIAIGNHKAETKLINAVSTKNIVKAINTNDYKLAQKNWDKIKKILADACETTAVEDSHYFGGYREEYYSDAPVTKDNLKLIDHFLKKIKSKGIEYWFETEIKKGLDHWVNYINGDVRYTYRGWESFLNTRVQEDMKR